MRYGKLIGGLGVLVVLVSIVGSISTMFRGTFGLGGVPSSASPSASVGTVLFVLAVVFAAVVYGARSGRWLTNPYW
jgi:ABC-type lipoprotein release transport system permease subunit